jgi:cytidyltransferase-like protein
MKTVMVSGYFDPFHDVHLDYLEQSVKFGDLIICVLASDKQITLKKGRVNIPENGRLKIISLILKGLGYKYRSCINIWDKDTSITESLRILKPDILFRGYDKALDTMLISEREVCNELNIDIIHAVNRIGERHGSEFK